MKRSTQGSWPNARRRGRKKSSAKNKKKKKKPKKVISSSSSSLQVVLIELVSRSSETKTFSLPLGFWDLGCYRLKVWVSILRCPATRTTRPRTWPSRSWRRSRPRARSPQRKGPTGQTGPFFCPVLQLTGGCPLSTWRGDYQPDVYISPHIYINLSPAIKPIISQTCAQSCSPKVTANVAPSLKLSKSPVLCT